MRPKKGGPISPLVQILWGGRAPPPLPPSFYTPGTSAYDQVRRKSDKTYPGKQ